MKFIKHLGFKTAAFLSVLFIFFVLLIVFWALKLLSVWTMVAFGIGCIIFFALNVKDRKDQLKRQGEKLVEKADGLMAKAEIKGAMRDYEKALEMAGPHIGAYLGLGNCYRSLGDNKKARENAKKALELKADSPAALYLMAVCLLRDDEPDRALKNLESAVQLNPDLTDAYLLMAEIHSNLQRKEDALRDYSIYLEKSKDEKGKKLVRERIEKLKAK
ncbi:MAG: tetratricopeptide repeat protein [Candidatus Eremiobacteraeota bacterium]|nr:tetratricopeptide repeat protein [Candidatus Eremiobacteraeota bacterium]